MVAHAKTILEEKKKKKKKYETIRQLFLANN